MSQSHIRNLKASPAPTPWWPIALGFVSVAILFVVSWSFVNWANSFRPVYETAPAKILEIRRVVDGIDAGYRGRIRHGFEAHVEYGMNGRMQDRWLRVSDDLPKEMLLIKLGDHPTECLVYWPQNHPENARCSLK